MTERRDIEKNPDITTVRRLVEKPGFCDVSEQQIARTVYEMRVSDDVASDCKVHKYEVGQIFGPAKYTSRTSSGEKPRVNEWFRENGGI